MTRSVLSGGGRGSGSAGWRRVTGTGRLRSQSSRATGAQGAQGLLVVDRCAAVVALQQHLCSRGCLVWLPPNVPRASPDACVLLSCCAPAVFRERDIGEKVALGMANVGTTGEVQYDTRLFNQEQGMGTGFGAEDSYNLYDKPLFASRDSNLFRPVRGQDDELHGGGGADEGGVRTDKFKADRGFTGAEGAAGGKRGSGVEYESTGKEADPFGLDAFMSDVSRGGDGSKRPLDGIGQRGGMAAGGGGGGGGGYEGGGGSRRMEFTSGSSREGRR